MRKRAASHLLTALERQIVELRAEGRSNAEIAGLLSLPPESVEDQVAVILQKIGAFKRLEVALLALRRGLVK